MPELPQPRSQLSQSAIISFRWVAVLPAAAVSAYSAWFLITVLNRISLTMMGFDPDSFVDRLFIEFTSGGAMGAAFVYAGTKVAPSSKHAVVFVLAGLAVITAGFLLFPSLQAQNGWAILSGAATALGAGSIAWSVHSGEIQDKDL